MAKIFSKDKRPIGIKISEGFITFHYPEEDWREFYGIPIKDWYADKTERLDRDDNWHTHMKQKTWFTKEMYDYIETIIP